MQEHIQLKKSLGSPSKIWLAHDVRDAGGDYVAHGSTRVEMPVGRLVASPDVAGSKFYDWCGGQGRLNEHNAPNPATCGSYTGKAGDRRLRRPLSPSNAIDGSPYWDGDRRH